MTQTDMEEALDAVLIPDLKGEHTVYLEQPGRWPCLGTFSLLPGVCLDELLSVVRSGGWDDVDRLYIDHETMGGA